MTHDVNAIRARLPHRYPFLMIDRIIAVGADFAVGLKNVTANEPYFTGHFPGRPIMPGVLITEALMQTSAFIGVESPAAPPSGRQFVCVDFAMKFRRMVTPGDQLRLEVRLIRALGKMAKMSAIARVGSSVAASGDLTLSVYDSSGVNE